jgi:hypothetical protein
LVNILKDIQTCCFLLDWLQVAAELLFLFSESRIRFAADRSQVFFNQKVDVTKGFWW